MQIVPIVPTKFLRDVSHRLRTHLILAHIVEKDEKYAAFYRNLAKRGDVIILDNSDFELPGNDYTPADLLKFAEMSGANVLMAPETYQDGKETSEKILNFCSRVDSSKVKVFGTIHGKTNEEILACHEAVVDKVAWIGLSCRLSPKPVSCDYWTDNAAMNASIMRNAFVHWMRPYMRKDVKYHLLGLNHPYELAHYSTVPEIYSNDSSCAFANTRDGKDVSNTFSYVKPPGKFDFDYDGDIDLRLLVKNLRTIEIFASLSRWFSGSNLN